MKWAGNVFIIMTSKLLSCIGFCELIINQLCSVEIGLLKSDSLSEWEKWKSSKVKSGKYNVA